MTTTLTILGCASSGGVPRAGGADNQTRWGACDPSNPKNTRMRCAALLSRTSPEGTTYTVIDTGPDFRTQMLAHDVPHLDGVVYTHEHADHLHGIDDLRPFALVQRERITVHMDAATYARAQAAFGYVFETPAGSNYPPILKRSEIRHDQPVSVDGAGGALKLQPIPVEHGDITALGFRIKNCVYLPDVSAIPEASLQQLAGLDCLIIDCLRRRPHPSHFNVHQALALIDEVKPKRAVLTNLHNDLDYATLLEETPTHVEPAYDGMQIELV